MRGSRREDGKEEREDGSDETISIRDESPLELDLILQ